MFKSHWLNPRLRKLLKLAQDNNIWFPLLQVANPGLVTQALRQYAPADSVGFDYEKECWIGFHTLSWKDQQKLMETIEINLEA